MNYDPMPKCQPNFCRILIFILIITILILGTFPNTYPNTSDHQAPIFNIENDSRIPVFSRGERSGYDYHNYSSLVSDLFKLNSTYPNLIELSTAQDTYGLADCHDGYKIWIVRVTNESFVFNKPEVLFLGGHHGNEPISIEVPYYLIEYLLLNYATNDHIRYLLDHREIYIIPVLNPWGWENNQREDYNSEDVNRDYPYANDSGNKPLTTIGAKTVYHIMEDHIFSLSLSWHSGDHLIYYAWGSPAHNTINDESPDDLAFFEVAGLMSEYAGGSVKYPYGPANQLFYYDAAGAWSDYAYAGSWDVEYLNPGLPTIPKGARSLAIGVEISTNKKPSINELGNISEVEKQTGTVNGYIPQNIRMGLVLIDLAEPYLEWINKESIPKTVTVGEKLNLSWYVKGSFQASKTRIIYSTDKDPSSVNQFMTKDRSGKSHWLGKSYTEQIAMPTIPGDYYFVAHAQVDQNTLIQNNPEPKIKPQSFFVQHRTNDSWSAEIKRNILNGSKDWYSSVIHIKVITDNNNQIWISNHDKSAFCNEQFNITWDLVTDGSLNSTELFWGRVPDPIYNSEFITEPDRINKFGEYELKLDLPPNPGYYYFIAGMIVEYNKTKDVEIYWSQVLRLEVAPKEPYLIEVPIPDILYTNGHKQLLEIVNITGKNPFISSLSLNNSNMTQNEVAILRFDPLNLSYLPNVENSEIIVDLVWSEEHEYWYLPPLNVSSWPEGWYQVIIKFVHQYGIGGSNNSIDLELSNWFKLEHIISVSQPSLEFIKNGTKIEKLNILNVSGMCSLSEIGNIEPAETTRVQYSLKNMTNDLVIWIGELKWSSINSTWEQIDIDVSRLKPGGYYITCSIYIDGIDNGTYPDGDSLDYKRKTAFEIFEQNNIEPDDPKDDGDFDSLVMIIGIIIIILILLVLIIIIHLKKKILK